MPILPAALELLADLAPVLSRWGRTLALLEEALAMGDLVSTFDALAAPNSPRSTRGD